MIWNDSQLMAAGEFKADAIRVQVLTSLRPTCYHVVDRVRCPNIREAVLQCIGSICTEALKRDQLVVAQRTQLHGLEGNFQDDCARMNSVR
jgi:hypothetical protein